MTSAPFFSGKKFYKTRYLKKVRLSNTSINKEDFENGKKRTKRWGKTLSK